MLIYWKYTVVVRPVVTCAATVWPRVILKTRKTEHSEFQTITCLGTIRAMRTTLTDAIEDLLGLPSLQWKPKSEGYGQACMTQDMENETNL
jgi:hypothetical protein